MTADNKVELIGPIDGDALMKWIEECDLVIHFKPELYIKLRDGDFALVPSPSSGDALEQKFMEGFILGQRRSRSAFQTEELARLDYFEMRAKWPAEADKAPKTTEKKENKNA